MIAGKPFQKSAAKLPEGMRVKAPTRDIAGQRFGRLLVVEVVGKHTNNSLIWRCLCDCGKEIERTSAGLRKAKGMCSCGCYLKEISRERLSKIVPWNKGTTYANKPAEEEYLNKKAWGVAVIRIKGNQCEVCGWDKARCDVHHKVARSAGGRNTIDNGRVLCPNCHRIEHAKEWSVQSAANDNIKKDVRNATRGK